MAIPFLWFPGPRAASGRQDHGGGRGAAQDDAALRALLDRGDDRLLRDAGLTREGVLGPSGLFWSAWSRRQRHPML